MIRIVDYLKSFFMSLMMFTVIPIRKNVWNERSLPYVLSSFPFVGFTVGLIWYIVTEITFMLNLPVFLGVAIVLLTPFFITGFIHIDGFMDTSDAVFSSVDIKKRYAILKDSHVGTFAVVSILSLFIILIPSVYYAYSAKGYFLMFIFIPVISRSLCSISIYMLPSLSDKGFVAMLKKDTGIYQTMIVIFILIASIALSFYLYEIAAVITIFAEIVFFVLSLLFGYKKLGGISGDLCGFALTISEAAAILILSLNLFGNIII